MKIMNYKLSDTVLYRVMQIVQEAMLTGIDCVDLLRMIRLEPVNGSEELVLTQEYMDSVIAGHQKMLDDIKHLSTKPIGDA